MGCRISSGALSIGAVETVEKDGKQSSRGNCGNKISHSFRSGVGRASPIVILQDTRSIDQKALKALRETQQRGHLSLGEIFVSDHRFMATVVGVFVVRC